MIWSVVYPTPRQQVFMQNIDHTPAPWYPAPPWSAKEECFDWSIRMCPVIPSKSGLMVRHWTALASSLERRWWTSLHEQKWWRQTNRWWHFWTWKIASDKPACSLRWFQQYPLPDRKRSHAYCCQRHELTSPVRENRHTPPDQSGQKIQSPAFVLHSVLLPPQLSNNPTETFASTQPLFLRDVVWNGFCWQLPIPLHCIDHCPGDSKYLLIIDHNCKSLQDECRYSTRSRTPLFNARRKQVTGSQKARSYLGQALTPE